MTYNILSPDGIPISPDNFPDLNTAQKYYFKIWEKPYKKQGFYSSPQHGRIAWYNIWEYCSIKEVPHD